MPYPMKKILIANRGEIARRIIRTCKRMNIQTVAVYSDADQHAPFVFEADEAYHIGPSPSSESYLKQDKLIEIMKQTGCDGVHPGYGFLSENAGFAEKVKQAGIKFIGPSPSAMQMMGSKLEAKAAVMHYDVPLVPGTEYAIADPEEGRKIADSIGYPVLIKASAGGGGKGMRLVDASSEFVEKMALAQSEARSSFGDDAVFIEKFVTSPRHIEIQVFADAHGNVVYLFERECSIQRRHQKVVEEAPSAVLTPELRKQMGEAACNVARACQYEGAGTVEFLLDADHKFYFLEMNTRLQVEHPVTEMITGQDLVEWQIRVARGEKLPLMQEELTMNGHALELRLYAEDALSNFMPNIGKLTRYRPPAEDWVRYDHGYEEGMEIPLFYDPMISKLCVWGPDRNTAILRMIQAIDGFQLSGVTTTLDFGKFVMKHDAFISGNFDTNFVPNYFSHSEVMLDAQAKEKDALAGVLDKIWEKEIEHANKRAATERLNLV
jgi:acetyl-CoA carboxylase biotin carboxylase subunit